MTTLTRELAEAQAEAQAEALARLGGYSPCQCEPNCTAYTDADGEACAFNPVEDAEQFDRILFAYWRKAMTDPQDCQSVWQAMIPSEDQSITDWRAAVLVAISDEVK